MIKKLKYKEKKFEIEICIISNSSFIIFLYYFIVKVFAIPHIVSLIEQKICVGEHDTDNFVKYFFFY